MKHTLESKRAARDYSVRLMHWYRFIMRIRRERLKGPPPLVEGPSMRSYGSAYRAYLECTDSIRDPFTWKNKDDYEVQGTVNK